METDHVPTTWAEVLATPAADPRRRRDDLVELIWAGQSPFVDVWAGFRRSGGPTGEPRKAALRSAGAELAQLLLDHPDVDGADPARRWMATVGQHAFPLRDRATGRPDPSDEVALRSDALWRSWVDLAVRHGDDPHLLAVAGTRTAEAAGADLAWERRAQVAASTREHAARAHHESASRSAMDILLARIPWADPPGVARLVSESLALLVVMGVARRAGDARRYADAAAARRDLLAGLGAARPDIAGSILSSLAQEARSRGDRDAFEAAERAAHDSWLRTARPDRERHHLGVRAANQRLLGDERGAEESQRRRIAVGAEDLGHDPGSAVDPPAALRMLAVAAGLEVRPHTALIGNVAYDICLSLYRLNATASPAGLREAQAWLQVASTAWAGFGVNGPNSVRLMGARLTWLRTDPADAVTRSALVGELLQVSAGAVRSGSRDAALRLALEIAGPDDPRPYAEVERIAPDALWRTRQQLRVVQAEWSVRSDPTPAVLGDVVRRSKGALRALRAANPEVNAPWVGRAALVVAEGLRLLEQDDAEQLAHLTLAVRSLGAQLTATVTDVGRARLRSTYAPALRRAMELVALTDDHDAADRLMEALRRDRVGALLLRLATTPSIGAEVRRVAQAVIAVNRAAADRRPPPRRPEP